MTVEIPTPFETESSVRKSFRMYLWFLTRFIVAGILFFSAFEKVKQFGPIIPLDFDSFIDAPVIRFLTLTLESAFAVWALGGLNPKLTRYAIIAAFVVFAGISFSKGLMGKDSCGCFGAVKVNPYITFTLDLIIALVAYLSITYPSANILYGRNRIFKIVLISFLCIVIPSVYAVSAYMRTFRDAFFLENVADSYSRGDTIVLKPERWLKKECPLLKYCGNKENLSKGQWLIMIYRDGCGACKQTLPKALEIAKHKNISMALVNIEDSTETINNVELCDKLDANYNWFIQQLPSAFIVDDAKVIELLF